MRRQASPASRRETLAAVVSTLLVCTQATHSAAAVGQGTDKGADPQSEPRDTVVVTGSQVDLPPDDPGGQVARGGRIGILGNQDRMDVPFNVTSYTSDFIRDTQANSVADVLASDAAVRVARGFGNFQELYFIRGFPLDSDDVSYNGLYGVLPRQYVATEFIDRVEVFRGANTFVNGAAPAGSGIGGGLNLVPKRADEDLQHLTAGFENSAQLSGAADLSRRFGDGSDWGLRFNAARHDGLDPVEGENRKLSMASIGADYRGPVARFRLDLGWQNFRVDAPRPSVTPTGAIPDPPPAGANFAQPWTVSGERDFFGALRGEFYLGDRVRIWAAAGGRDGTERNILANPKAAADGATVSYRFDNFRRDLVLTGDSGVTATIGPDSFLQTLTAAGSIYRLNSRNAYDSSNYSGFKGDLYEPVAVASPTPTYVIGGVLFDPLTTRRVTTSSVALADTLAFAEQRVRLTLGGRFQVILQDTYDYNSGALKSEYDKSAVTPAAGLVFKAARTMSIYANYMEALIQGAVAPAVLNGVSVANAGEIFAPFRSKQEEVGIKVDSGALGGTLALFRTTEPSALLDGTVYRDAGEQRNRGIELSWYGKLGAAVRILGGVTLLDARMVRSQNGVGDGARIIGVPNTQANLELEWDPPAARGLTVGGRVVYTGSESAEAADAAFIPSWVRADFESRYAWSLHGKLAKVRARITNLTNRDYWASSGGDPGASYLVLGAPRTFVVSLSIDL